MVRKVHTAKKSTMRKKSRSYSTIRQLFSPPVANEDVTRKSKSRKRKSSRKRVEIHPGDTEEDGYNSLGPIYLRFKKKRIKGSHDFYWEVKPQRRRFFYNGTKILGG